jgi:hypothetical protein
MTQSMMKHETPGRRISLLRADRHPAKARSTLLL